jgi:ComF family protein
LSSSIEGLVQPRALPDKHGMQMAVQAARSAARHIVDFALPPRCPGCGIVTEDDHRFCLQCWQQLRFLGDPCCDRCGLPFEYESGAGAECGRFMADPPHYDRLRAAVGYGEIARRVALKLKYGGRPGVAATIAHFMQRHLAGEDEGTILVPVPLHRWRIWKRGYNQSALIAASLAARTGLRAENDLLRRVRATPVLRGMGRSERAAAVRGAFQVTEAGKEALRGRTVILIDDVYTSGATANACAKTLKRAGAKSVNIICWARVLDSSED